MPTLPRTEESIFAVALEISSLAQRAVFLQEACGSDGPLRARVENLLKSHTGAGSFLVKPVAATIDEPLSERPGTIIGPYKLLQQIGEGGMGVVYMAEQETPVRRRVAVKIIKPGMDSRQVIARFEAERQALAMMDHQNIARVLDAGTTESGRPYFVMELVHGVPLTKFCDDNRLTLRQRLELFLPVCQAIQHAHQKGIIHRDIKPGNILVTMYDDKPVPKVIDFGVAKAVEQRLTEKTLFTQYGTLVGTFEYMSPEQAEMNAFGVDTRSDVYSLGVLLYELLTGTTPLERQRLREAAFVEVVRLIKEEEPQRPSIRLSTSQALPKVAAACNTEPARLSQLVRGELDWIVMKCLEKDRTRRYETVNGLARDVQRYLHDEPVEACPPSLAYRLRKFARKHRGMLTTAASFVALLVVGLIFSTWLAIWAVNSQQAAQAARKDAMAALARERAARKEAVAAKEEVELASQRIGQATQLANEGIEFQFRGNRAAALDKFAQAQTTESKLNTTYVYRRMLYTDIGLWDLAAADYAESFRLTTRAHVQTCYEHAVLQSYIGDHAGYRGACQELLRQHGDLQGPDAQMLILRACCLSSQPMEEPAAIALRAEKLAAASNKPWHQSAAALAFVRAGNPTKAVEMCQQFHATDLDSSKGVHRINFAIEAIALHALSRDAEGRKALPTIEAALDEWTKEIAEGPVGTMPLAWSDWLQALILYREAKFLVTGLPPAEDQRLASVRERALELTLGDALSYMEAAHQAIDRKAWDEAADNYAKALDKFFLNFRPGQPDNMQRYMEMGQQPEVFDRLVKLRPNHYFVWVAHGRMLAARRQWAQAAADFDKALTIAQMDDVRPIPGVTPPDPLHRAMRQVMAMYYLAELRLLAGDEAGYRDLCAKILSLANEFDEPLRNNPILNSHVSRLCTIGPAGISDYSLPLRYAERTQEQDPQHCWHPYGIGAAHYRSGRYEEAIGQLEESLRQDPSWLGRGQNHAYLAMACQKLGRTGQARDWLAKAKVACAELEQSFGKAKYGFATTNYLGDWIALQLLIPEAEKLLTSENP